MGGPLHGVRVLDFGRYVAGPWAGQLLRGFGADVIRIERPGGGEDRPLFPLGAEGIGAYIVHCNRGKRSMTLNPTKPAGREVVQRLVRGADVIVANVPDETLVSLGIDWDTVQALNPRTVLATVTSYGTTGSYAGRLGFDGIGQAMCGSVHLSGWPGAPAKTFVPWVDFQTASLLALGVMGALVERASSGVGRRVESSLLAAALGSTGHVITEEAVLGLDRQATGNRHFACAPSDIVATADGWVQIQVVGEAMFGRWAAAIGRPELVGDPHYGSDIERGNRGEELSAIFHDWTRSRSTAEVLEEMQRAEVPTGPVLSPRQVLGHDHVQATALTSVAVPGFTEPVTAVTHPVRFDGAPLDLGDRVAELGEDTDSVLAELGYDADEIATMRRDRVV